MDKLILIDLNKIEPDPDQPRKDFEEEALHELADSIKAVGLKTPISVRRHPTKDNFFMIIAGERRYRAHRMLGLKEIRSIIESQEGLSPDSIYAHQLTENLFRKDLNPVEKAEFVQGRIDYLRNRQGVKDPKKQVARELGVSPSWVTKSTAILKFVPELRKVAREGKIRDYYLLNKLNNLGSRKRKEAVGLIESGEFNSTDFFRRKRYDGKSTKASDDLNIPNEQQKASLPEEDARPINFKFSLEQCVTLIDRTDFKFVLDKQDPEWRSKDRPMIQSYTTLFKDWLVQECQQQN